MEQQRIDINTIQYIMTGRPWEHTLEQEHEKDGTNSQPQTAEEDEHWLTLVTFSDSHSSLRLESPLIRDAWISSLSRLCSSFAHPVVVLPAVISASCTISLHNVPSLLSPPSFTDVYGYVVELRQKSMKESKFVHGAGGRTEWGA